MAVLMGEGGAQPVLAAVVISEYGGHINLRLAVPLEDSDALDALSKSGEVVVLLKVGYVLLDKGLEILGHDREVRGAIFRFEEVDHESLEHLIELLGLVVGPFGKAVQLVENVFDHSYLLLRC